MPSATSGPSCSEVFPYPALPKIEPTCNAQITGTCSSRPNPTTGAETAFPLIIHATFHACFSTNRTQGDGLRTSSPAHIQFSCCRIGREEVILCFHSPDCLINMVNITCSSFFPSMQAQMVRTGLAATRVFASLDFWARILKLQSSTQDSCLLLWFSSSGTAKHHRTALLLPSSTLQLECGFIPHRDIITTLQMKVKEHWPHAGPTFSLLTQTQDLPSHILC